MAPVRWAELLASMKPTLFLCLAAVLMVGCRTSQHFAPHFSQSLCVSNYESGRIGRHWIIYPNSKEHQLLVDWLIAHQIGWKRSWVTYAPHILVSGTNFSMNIYSSGLIINTRGGQYEMDAPASDFQFLNHAPGP